MPTSSGPNTVNDSVIFTYDVADTSNSYKGRPTDNLVANATLNVYNNVTSDVTATITQTSDYYKGAPIWKETITPTTSTGVSYLTNGNNPGVGVYHTGGGGIANRYAGHTIFFKPIGPMYSAPIFTNYSNIVGWQSSQQYDDMGDGWFRAKVLWYDTTTRTDSKYWAINPAGAIIDAPITIYWAGPFKEDLNSQYISQFVNGTRSVSGSLLDISGTSKSINVANVSFDSNVQINFDGTDDYVDVDSNLGTLSQYTIEHISYKGSEDRMPIASRTNTNFYQFGDNSWRYTHGGVGGEYYYPKTKTISGWGHWIIVYTGAAVKIYRNGVYEGQQTTTGTANWTDGIKIGNWDGSAGYAWNGQIAIVKIYNRTLSINEVVQNYNSYKKRFNLS
jgi:hypothetical protein